MKRQEIIRYFTEKPVIVNDPLQSVSSDTAMRKVFLEYLQGYHSDIIGEEETRVYLHYCTKEKNFSFSAVRRTAA